ncbi:Chitin synthase 4, partial [Coemansia sp. S17]
MRHIIGVPPRNYEYLLQVDADTEVMPDSLSRLVAACTGDRRIAGICGETMLGNESQSWTTMMQVYEYFISHHMAKAFESLFGSVTCLPGCFCMYRLRTVDGKPLLLAKPVLEAYSELHVDTLHKKNLLSLGEDRYLTTLMMKHFPQYKLKFIQDAKCKTIAPEKWSVLMSQRRRWINSTIHNLAELMFLPNMCGFCFFSMRFVVFLDLFGTVTMPTTLIYFGYLIYIAVTGIADVGYISLILIGAIYGLQAIIFLLRREWQHIGWMIIYLLAYPLWSFVLPIYSFWHMDDFSWGNTRVVVDDGKRKIIVSDDKPFDPASIPQRRWMEYEKELAVAGVLNAPPPNMNPNAGSTKEDDRLS